MGGHRYSSPLFAISESASIASTQVIMPRCACARLSEVYGIASGVHEGYVTTIYSPYKRVVV